jgi:N-acetylglutamate synthase-like GNAT family acetyltransferase
VNKLYFKVNLPKSSSISSSIINLNFLKSKIPFFDILLAYFNGVAVGCVALQQLPEEGVCEMKRLYVQPAFRKYKIGDALVAEIIKEAKRLSYSICSLFFSELVNKDPLWLRLPLFFDKER